MSLVSQLTTGFTRVATEFKAIRTLIGGSATADITALTTTDKTSLVAAINEVQAGSSGAPPDASTTVKGVVELATDAETATGTDAVRAVTPAGLASLNYGAAPADASATVKGIVELATDAEASTGTDTVRALTPANAAAVYLKISQKGANNGLAELDGSGKVPAAQIPGSYDDVLEFANLAAFPGAGETGKIYVALDTNLTYRWTGSVYGVLDPSLALGETSTTAYRGDRGKTAYDHSQVVSGNPHNVTAAEVGALSTANAGDHTTDFAAGFVAALA